MQTTDLHKAMADLNTGRINPDEFRAIMRASRAANGEAEHEQMKGVAAFALMKASDAR